MLNLLNLAAFLATRAQDPNSALGAQSSGFNFCLQLSEVNLGITYGSLTGAFGPTNSSLSAKYHTLITPSGGVQGQQQRGS